MNEADIELLEDYGWSVDCESPFELSNENGDRATGEAADIVLEYFRELDEMEDQS